MDIKPIIGAEIDLAGDEAPSPLGRLGEVRSRHDFLLVATRDNWQASVLAEYRDWWQVDACSYY